MLLAPCISVSPIDGMLTLAMSGLGGAASVGVFTGWIIACVFLVLSSALLARMVRRWIPFFVGVAGSVVSFVLFDEINRVVGLGPFFFVSLMLILVSAMFVELGQSAEVPASNLENTQGERAKISPDN